MLKKRRYNFGLIVYLSERAHLADIRVLGTIPKKGKKEDKKTVTERERERREKTGNLKALLLIKYLLTIMQPTCARKTLRTID